MFTITAHGFSKYSFKIKIFFNTVPSKIIFHWTSLITNLIIIKKITTSFVTSKVQFDLCRNRHTFVFEPCNACLIHRFKIWESNIHLHAIFLLQNNCTFTYERSWIHLKSVDVTSDIYCKHKNLYLFRKWFWSAVVHKYMDYDAFLCVRLALREKYTGNRVV